MSEREHAVNVSRRQVLKSFGLASVAAAPLLSSLPGKAVASTAKNIASWSRPIALGVLVPQSNIHPLPSESFLNGMQLRLDAINREFGAGSVSLLVEETGCGVGKTIGASKKLAKENRADLVVGFVNPRAIHWIRDTFESSRIPFVAASTGECIPDNAGSSPYIFHCSLNQWQAHMAMGTWTAAHAGRRAAVITSFHDSGYDTLPAFRRGFEEAGGEIISTHVIDVPNSFLTMDAALAEIAASGPDIVYAMFSDVMAEDFIYAYERSTLDGRIPVFSAGLMMEQRLMAHRGTQARAIVNCAPWSEQLQTPENVQFMAAYQQMAGRPADSYALLGYDTASLVAGALAASKGDASRARFLHALREASFVSPRGRLAMDPRTQSIITPLYLRQSTAAGNGITNHVVTELPKIKETSARKLMAAHGATSGWLNSYISA